MSRLLLLSAFLIACGGSDAQPQASDPPPDPSLSMRVVSIAAGEQHSVAVLEDGSVWTWGNSGNGQLGREVTIEDYLLPTRVAGVTGRWATAGGSTSYVYDGEHLWTTGYNHQGYLGYGPTGDEQTFSSRPFPALQRLDAFGSEIIALGMDSTVHVWGDGRSGQLGNGTTPSVAQVEPLHVAQLREIAAVSAGDGFLLALQRDGRLWAWGQNAYGTLGTPDVPSLASTTRTAAGTAVRSSAAGAGTFSAVPVIVPLTNVIGMDAGGEHALAIRGDSTVWAWGRNSHGEVGQPDERETFLEPIQVPGLTSIAKVQAGTGFSLALQSDGTLWLWGSGDRATASRHVPRRVPLRDVIDIEAGSYHAFAVTRDGSLYGWGLADMGQVGSEQSEGETDWPPIPVRFVR